MLLPANFAAAAPTVREEAKGVVVTGEQYRVTFVRETMDVMFELRGTDGQWHPAVKRGAEPPSRRDGLLWVTRDAVADDGQGRLWSPPRIGLSPTDWTGYLFWDADGKPHEGRIADLAPLPAYAGVSPWEQRGDTVKRRCRRIR